MALSNKVHIRRIKKQMVSGNKNIIPNDGIRVELSVTLGTADLRVHQLLKLGRGAVVELDRGINDYVDIYANDVLIGRGEVIITENDSIGISVTEMIGSKG
ncbi:MAG: FliM/FliN family flagellar motor switch protein [Alphaproteobacteria bacterium]|nr:FliM/FliN family flagellar motor switch protein [Alphaproteobacteria bacterium]MBQ8631112.1 FliM/FliN family flagellar motor switch protein [Alphaproteobacteria bacterium]